MRTALAQAALVTFLWSTSWVLIKIGLTDLALPPLLFAGLRYALAGAILVVVAAPALRRTFAAGPRRRPLLRVAFLGVLVYAVTQGAQFAALIHLPAVAVSLVLTGTPVIVALIGMRGIESASPAQLVGMVALIAGAALYFGPLDLGATAAVGLLIAGVGLLANALSAVLGRQIAREALADVGGVLGLTALSMAVGAAVLLAAGLAVERLPPVPIEGWLIVGWLAVVNTAFAFTLWNHTLRTLTAVESSVMNNLMLVQIAVLAWVFLGEALDAREITGLALALAGVLAVQLAGARRGRAAPETAVGPTPPTESSALEVPQ